MEAKNLLDVLNNGIKGWSTWTIVILENAFLWEDIYSLGFWSFKTSLEALVRRIDATSWYLSLSQADTNLRDNVIAIKQTRSRDTRSLEIKHAIDRTYKRLTIKKGYL